MVKITEHGVAITAEPRAFRCLAHHVWHAACADCTRQHAEQRAH